MIPSHSVAFGQDYVMLNWTHPRFQPEKYQLNYVCTMKPTCIPSQETNHSFITKTQNLSSDTTSVTIPDIRPSSICMLFLLAVYNPASIDSGITITGTTVDEHAMNVNSGLNYFIKTFLIMSLVIHENVCVFVCVYAYIHMYICILGFTCLFINLLIVDLYLLAYFLPYPKHPNIHMYI